MESLGPEKLSRARVFCLTGSRLTAVPAFMDPFFTYCRPFMASSDGFSGRAGLLLLLFSGIQYSAKTFSFSTWPCSYSSIYSYSCSFLVVDVLILLLAAQMAELANVGVLLSAEDVVDAEASWL